MSDDINITLGEFTGGTKIKAGEINANLSFLAKEIINLKKEIQDIKGKING